MTTMPQDRFRAVEMAPVDPILGISESFKADTNPDKVNLTVGVYQDDTGVSPVMAAVKRAERLWQEQETTKTYLGMAGEPRFGELVRELILGAGHAALNNGRAVTVQAPGGTGALRVGADFIRSQFPGAAMWVSDPTWPNHPGIFGAAGLEVRKYPYYDAEAHSLRFEALCQAIHPKPGRCSRRSTSSAAGSA